MVAVAGPPAAVSCLLGVREPAQAFDAELARAERWGRLRFVPHDRYIPGGLHSWVPDSPVPDDADGWHPLDALYAPLTSAAGELVGILSVDLPSGGRRPDRQQRQLLELFAMQAGTAIVNASLAEQLRAERAELAAEHARLQAGGRPRRRPPTTAKSVSPGNPSIAVLALPSLFTWASSAAP